MAHWKTRAAVWTCTVASDHATAADPAGPVCDSCRMLGPPDFEILPRRYHVSVDPERTDCPGLFAGWLVMDGHSVERGGNAVDGVPLSGGDPDAARIFESLYDRFCDARLDPLTGDVLPQHVFRD